ncbi:PilN domain-containing protein [Methylotenera versatilis]|uniref:PilN domain-containing protein n=1 Tax=Methylotenera versatilis TaxID=1055487 RepID=UPI00064612A6|nr:PilN domain-containing protein [Methylotenera versatilis]
MMRINLLPHRQLKRAERQRQFGLMALMAAVVAGAVVFMGWTYLSAKKDSQIERNGRLEQAIVQLDKEIADIKDLKDQISNVLERKQIVENLQTNRSQSVVILDELSRQLPEGLYLKSIKQQGNLITLEGVADTNARVATLVRNLSVSNWMESPNLIEIKAMTLNGIKQNDFTLNVSLKVQKAEEAPNKNKIKGK